MAKFHINNWIQQAYQLNIVCQHYRKLKSNFQLIVFDQLFVNLWAMLLKIFSTLPWHSFSCHNRKNSSTMDSYFSLYIGTYKVSLLALSFFFFVDVIDYLGTLYTSLFVLGHDCGHGSFSNHPLLNDTVGKEFEPSSRTNPHWCFYLLIGTILHSWILAPYYTWKVNIFRWKIPWRKNLELLFQLTHSKHHKNTNNIDKDEVFYPQRGVAHEDSLMDDIFFWFPGVGWFYYLFCGYTPRTINHFNPVSEHEFLLIGSTLECSRIVCSSNRCFTTRIYLVLVFLLVLISEW